MATGWLGMTHEAAMNTPIPCIFITLRAKAKFMRMCNGEDVRTPASKIRDQLRKIGK